MNLEVNIKVELHLCDCCGSFESEETEVIVRDPSTHEIIDSITFCADGHFGGGDYSVENGMTDLMLLIVSWIHDVDRFEVETDISHYDIQIDKYMPFTEIKTLGLLKTDVERNTNGAIIATSSLCIPNHSEVHYAKARGVFEPEEIEAAQLDAIYKLLTNDFIDIDFNTEYEDLTYLGG